MIKSSRNPVTSSINSALDSFVRNPSVIFLGLYKNVISHAYLDSVSQMSKFESVRVPPFQKHMSPVIGAALAIQSGIDKEQCGLFIDQLERNLANAFVSIDSTEDLMKIISITHDMSFLLKSIQDPYKHSSTKSVVDYIEKRSSEMNEFEMKTYSLHMEVLAWAFEKENHLEMAKALREFSEETSNFDIKIRQGIEAMLPSRIYQAPVFSRVSIANRNN